ncbi:hypothetical protein ACLKA6_001281 [Drosophila palustris]
MGQHQWLTIALLLSVLLISCWPIGSQASIDCADWQSPTECNNNTKNNNNNNNNNRIGSNSSNYIAASTSSSSSSSSSSLEHLNSSMLPDNLLEPDLERDGDNWPLERVVSTIVPVFFGIIGFAGLLGNVLVILAPRHTVLVKATAHCSRNSGSITVVAFGFSQIMRNNCKYYS